MPPTPTARYKAVVRQPKVYGSGSRIDVEKELRTLGAGWRFERQSPKKSGKTAAYRRPVWVGPDGKKHHSVAQAKQTKK